MKHASPSREKPIRSLSLFDTTCLIVGVIVGAGVYQMAPDIARGSGSWWGTLGVWALGGLISLFGALGYAELSSTFPREGGDYVYLTEAYGRWAGFLFGWGQTVVIRPSDIAALAFIFGTYFSKLFNPWHETDPVTVQSAYAALAVMVFMAINIIGVREGKWTQNLLTVFKTLGLLMVVVVGFIFPATQSANLSPETLEPFPFYLAVILVLYAYGGWSDMVCVAAEAKHPERNLLRAILLGLGTVTLLYLAINGAFLYSLGYVGMASSGAVATDVVAHRFPGFGAALISLLVCLSVLGSLNGVILTGSRISYAAGVDHRPLAFLGKWNAKTGTPVRSILVQGGIALLLIVTLRSFVDTVLYMAAIVYLFYFATSIGLIVLRFRQPQVSRPYRVTGYPITTLIFAGICLFLIYSAFNYKPWIALGSVAATGIGLPVYWIFSMPRRKNDLS